jgi:adenylyltransferase/sulfurtransferase
MVQATEVIKYLLGTGELLANRLLLWDGLRGQASEICVERNPSCETCGDFGKERRVRGGR